MSKSDGKESKSKQVAAEFIRVRGKIQQLKEDHGVEEGWRRIEAALMMYLQERGQLDTETLNVSLATMAALYEPPEHMRGKYQVGQATGATVGAVAAGGGASGQSM